MKASVHAASAWTPERGVLSAEDGLGQLSRFGRTCAAVVERVGVPDATLPIIVGTRHGATVSPAKVGEELELRWPDAEVSLLHAGADTLPVSLLDACLVLSRWNRVLWTVVDLQPGAELAACILLSRESSRTQILLERLDEPVPGVEPHLNPCAGIVALADAVGVKSVSIKVSSWSLALQTTA